MARGPARSSAKIGLLEPFSDVPLAEQSQRRRWRDEWRTGGRIIERLRREGVRAVVLSGYNDLGRIRVMRWGRAAGVPVLLWGDSNIHDDAYTLSGRPLKARIKRAIVGALLNLCAGALCAGSAGREYFRKYGVPDGRIFHFALEPDYAAIAATGEADIAPIRERFGLSLQRRRILYCGRLAPVKRVDLLLNAFSAIVGQRPEWDLVILGDGPLREHLQERASTAPRPRVNWLGHQADQAIVRAVQRSCDVLVFPSELEPWGLVVNEALAAGLAVVSAETVGAAVDLVRDGVNGRTFARNDEAGLIECLLDVTQADRLATMRAASSKVLAEWRRKADAVEGLRDALTAVGALPK